MAITQTARRALLAAAAFCVILLFLRSSSSPAPAPPSVEAAPGGEKSEEGVPTRSYPPPSPNKEEVKQQVVEDVASRPLRERLEYHFPYDIESKFPAYIWQTWKASPGAGAFEDRLRPLEASWSEKHPGFVHEVITDKAASHLINYLFASVPEVSEAYEAMPLPVIKADFFRYLILLAKGGIYSDIDTGALRSATEWLPSDFDRSTVGLVVGIEADPDREDWAKWYARRIQFCQWTIQSKPGHPVMRDIVATITEDTLRMKKAKQLRHGRPPPKSIMEYTGPGVWTDAIFSYMNNQEYFDFSSRSSNISYRDFFGITEHKKVGDVVVLPITSFSPGVGQMGAASVDDKMAFVKHEFDGQHMFRHQLDSANTLTGSWKPEKEKMINS